MGITSYVATTAEVQHLKRSSKARNRFEWTLIGFEFLKSPDSECSGRLRGSTFRSFSRRREGFQTQNHSVHANQEFQRSHHWRHSGNTFKPLSTKSAITSEITLLFSICLAVSQQIQQLALHPEWRELCRSFLHLLRHGHLQHQHVTNSFATLHHFLSPYNGYFQFLQVRESHSGRK